MGTMIDRVIIICGIEVTRGTDMVLRSLAELEGFVSTADIRRKIPSLPDHNAVLSKLNALWRKSGNELVIRQEPRPTTKTSGDQRHRMVHWKATDKLRAYYGYSRASSDSPMPQEGTS